MLCGKQLTHWTILSAPEIFILCVKGCYKHYIPKLYLNEQENPDTDPNMSKILDNSKGIQYLNDKELNKQ